MLSCAVDSCSTLSISHVTNYSVCFDHTLVSVYILIDTYSLGWCCTAVLLTLLFLSML